MSEIMSKSTDYNTTFSQESKSPVLKPFNKIPTTSTERKESESSSVSISSIPTPITRNDPVKAYIDSITARLGANTNSAVMSTSIRLLDENLQWQDSLSDHLLADNNGFLVVGVLGKKGTGKSTIMSKLAARSLNETKDNVFRVNHSSDLAKHCTNGVNAFVTCERMILLDVQV